MSSFLKKLPAPVRFLVSVYLSGMLLFTCFRLLLLCLHAEELKEIPASVIFQSLLMGLRFDAVINGYLLALPAVLFFVFTLFKSERRIAKPVSVFVVVVYAVAFFIHVTDIRWFSHGAARFTVSALQWTDTPGWMLKFLFQDIYNYPFILLFLVLVFFFGRHVRRIRRRTFENEHGQMSVAMNVYSFLVLFALMFIGIRGRFAMKSPIRWGTAFFSPYNFANQLGLNPVYTFMRSWLDKNESKAVRYNSLPEADAEEMVRKNLAVENYDSTRSPVARAVVSSGSPRRFNVVLVLMESMTAKNMKRFGNSGNITPVLDALYSHSISFSDFYSDGNHTFNGIYSSLYGYHSLPMVHHMKDITHQQPYSGLPTALREAGYHTTFFTTHDDQFDNMAGFLLPNGFEKIISEKDYPDDAVLSTLGVPDHIMFGKVISEMDRMRLDGKPMFMAMITGSNHEPFVLPEDISLKTHSPELAQRMVEYADWSVGKFISDASSHSWFDSTIFVFTGDHGGLISGCDPYLAFHHIPLIIYAPKIFSHPEEINDVCGQADIYATVCGLLNLSYMNNSMGIDLIHQQRKYFVFNFDEEICCVTKNNFLRMGHDQEHFFEISEDRKNLVATERSMQADSMKKILEATIQVTQRMIEGKRMK